MLAIPLLFVFHAASATVAGATRVRTTLAFALSWTSLAVLALWPPDNVTLRGFAWIAASMMAMRTLDVWSMAGRPLAARLGVAVTVYDPRAARLEAPTLDVPLFLRGLVYGAAGLGVYVLARWGVPHISGPAALAVRWTCGAAFFYCGMESLDGVARAGMRTLGLHAAPLQNAPYRSRSLTEFWGRRWNNEVGRWLNVWCFRPFARRGHATLGVVVAFVWSGLFHAVAGWAALGILPALSILLFFLLHGALVLAERRLRVTRWPRVMQHVWVIGVFGVTVPLFVEPGLQIVGVAP